MTPLVALALVGCFRSAPDGWMEIPRGEPVVIGLAVGIGSEGLVGDVARETVEAAQLASSRRDPLHGHGWEIHPVDARCDADASVGAAQTLVLLDGVAGVVGTTCSVAALTAAPIISEAGLTMISPSNTHPDLADPAVRSPGYFRVAGNDARQARRLAGYLRDIEGAESAAVVHDGSTYGLAMEAAVHDVLPWSDAPDLLYLALSPADAAVEAGAVTAPWVGGPDNLLHVDFLGADAAEGAFITRWADTRDPFAYPDLVGAWTDLHGAPPVAPFHAHAWDAAEVMLDALEEASEDRPDGALWIELEAVREEVGAIRLRPGLSGVLTCGLTGDCSTEPVEVLRVVDGQPLLRE